MYIEHLILSNFRNFTDVSIYPSKGINIINGINASGKTSLLESIYYLSLARSFRTSNTTSIINHGKKNLTVSATLINDNNYGLKHNLGIKRESSGKFIVKFDTKIINRASFLASNICVQLISPDTMNLIDGSPSIRREFIDWGCFYLFNDFADTYQKFKHVLKQRNSLLQSNNDIDFFDCWNDQFIEYSQKINNFRKQYLILFNEEIINIVNRILPSIKISLVLSPGFKESKEEFKLQLKNSYSREKILGFSTFGPHKSDLKIKANEKLTSEILSRGQQKLLIIIMRITQGLIYNKTQNKKCILLIDDITSELDSNSLSILCEYLKENISDFQCFITSINNNVNTLLNDSIFTPTIFSIEDNKVSRTN